MTIAYCQSLGFVPQIHQYAKQMQTVISLVSSDFGLALVPESLQHLKRTGVCYRPLREDSPIVELGAIYRKRYQNPAIPRFVEMLRAASVTYEAQQTRLSAGRNRRSASRT